jgi:hypothetical protein
MRPIHFRAVLALGAVVLLTGVLAIGPVVSGEAETTTAADRQRDNEAITAPVDAEPVIAEAQRNEQAQRLEAFAAAVEANQAEQAAQLEALAQAEQEAALRTLAQAEREAASGIPDGYWDRMAQCETGGNWSMVGSRYSGGLGFYNGTWDAFGGREFAARAGQATREQQIVVANRVADQVGLSGWGCLGRVGRP